MAKYQPKPTDRRFKDREGQVFGRLTVIGYLGQPRRPTQIWECRCECGNIISVAGSSLLAGYTKSCGCFRREATRAMKLKHGHNTSKKRTREYGSYHQILARCFRPKNNQYHNYGGRGITVCKRWLGDGGFERFLADMGPAPPGYTIERKDVNGNYCPENCCWISAREQCRNKRNTVYITANGRTLRLDQWCAETGLAYETLRRRLALGWSQHDAVSRPLRYHRQG